MSTRITPRSCVHASSSSQTYMRRCAALRPTRLATNRLSTTTNSVLPPSTSAQRFSTTSATLNTPASSTSNPSLIRSNGPSNNILSLSPSSLLHSSRHTQISLINRLDSRRNMSTASAESSAQAKVIDGTAIAK
jgi:hypothetical protein